MLQGPRLSGLCRKQAPLPRESLSASARQAYRHEATSVEGFVQQIACCYVPHGFWWYVSGRIPAHKDPAAIDRKLIERYGVNISKRTRARRKELGLANVHYLRHERFFVLLASRGRHRLFEEEGNVVRDLRKVPLKFRDYSISFRPGGRTMAGDVDPKWHAHVQIAPQAYKAERAYFLELANRKSVDQLAFEFRRVPYEPYAPIRRQLLNILRAVNRKRKAAGLAPVPTTALRLRRRVVQPFGPRVQRLSTCPSCAATQSPGELIEFAVQPPACGHGQADQAVVVGAYGNTEFPEEAA